MVSVPVDPYAGVGFASVSFLPAACQEQTG
jgi:hypothetical protein